MSEANVGERADSADRVVLSYAPPDPDAEQWSDTIATIVRDELHGGSYRRYLKQAHEGPVAVGDEWGEFVSCGCASPQDVRLRVEAVMGGAAIGETTDLVFERRGGD